MKEERETSSKMSVLTVEICCGIIYLGWVAVSGKVGKSSGYCQLHESVL